MQKATYNTEGIRTGQENYIRSLFVIRAEKEKKKVLERYRHLNPLTRPGQILLAGSSLMEQFSIHELLENRGIRLPLAVYNRGISGFTTTELLENMDVCVCQLRPSKIFLNIGTNDMNGPDYVEAEMIGRYRQILAGIREQLPEARLYLMAYYPVCPEAAKGHVSIEAVLKWRTKERIAAANEAVRQLAAETGAAYIDANEPITDENGFLKKAYAGYDLHMFGDGYDRVLDVLLPYLEN